MIERISEKELEKRFLAGQLMREITEKDSPKLTYSVGHPIKNCPLGRCKPEFVQNFSYVAQALWKLRSNPEYLSYASGDNISVMDLFGISKNEPVEDIEEIRKIYDGQRAVSVGIINSRDDQGYNLAELGNERTGLVYIPRLEGIAREGILTDLVQAYQRKALETPFDPEWLDEAEKADGKEWRDISQLNIVRKTTFPLFVGGLVIPHFYENNIDDWTWGVWDPLRMADEEKRQDVYRTGFRSLDDKMGHASQLVREYAPEHVERFERALNYQE